MQVYKDELYHHGIKGMRWGVRRYQNYDGTYTQAGLKRYRKAEENYNGAKKQYEEARKSSDKVTAKAAKATLRQTKHTLNNAYNALKYDKRADQGRKYYMRGERILDNEAKAGATRKVLGIGSSAVAYALSRQGKNKAAMISVTMAAAIGFGQSIYTKYKNDRLRAYYAHSGSQVDKENTKNTKKVTTASRTANKSVTKKTPSSQDLSVAMDRANEKFNSDTNHALSDLNKKWEGKYNTPEYEAAVIDLYNRFVDEEISKLT